MASALVIMDFEMGMVGRIHEADRLLEAVQATIAAARSANLPIIYVAVKFREGYPDISPRNKFFSVLKKRGTHLQESDPSSTIHPGVAPEPDDIIVTKRRISAFSGSDFEVVLRSGQIDHLILCGISTSGVVLSTVREAGDKDFNLTVLSDCCADADGEVHQLLMDKIFPRQATVCDHQEWIDQVTESETA